MKRRLLSIFLTLAMILLMLPNIAIMSAVADSAPWDGSGTEGSPYLIRDREDLLAIANAVNGGDTLQGKFFLQMKDIDLEDDEPWPTIGITINNAAHQFRGVFNGGDNNISGLYVNRGDDDAGLFGYVGEDGVIKNVHVKDGYVSGTYWVGGIAGRNYGIVEYCSFSGEVYGGQQFAGGIVGDNHGLVSYCCNEGDVDFNQIGGGVVGRNSGGTVENCYNRGYVCSNNIVRGYAGGVVGENTAGSTVDNCYSDGWVESNNDGMACGAIVGANGAGSTVKNCYYPEEFEEDGLSGVGGINGTIENVTPKSEEQFDSGEVAWELSQGTNGGGWGQTLSDDDGNHDKHPHFTQAPDKDYDTTPIYRVYFTANDPKILPEGRLAYYVDPHDDVELPRLPQDVAWFVGNEMFDGKNIESDINAYAGKRILFASENGIVHRLTYSPEAQTVDLDMYLKYAEGGPYSEGLFEYTITEDRDSLGAQISDDDLKTLTVPAGTGVKDGGYTLKITAHEKAPFIMPLALKPLDPTLADVEMIVNIIIEKATPVITVEPAATPAVTYGPALSAIGLSGGKAEHSATNSTEVPGRFAWSDGNTVPTVNGAAATGYPVIFTPTDDTNYNSVTIMIKPTVNKADIVPSTVIPPTPIDSDYNGKAEPLIDEKEPGSADGGTIKYWVTDDPDAVPPTDNSAYSATIPSHANAGTYYIWYKVIGDDNHNDFQDNNCFVTATIRPYELEIEEQHFIYNGGSEFTLELTGVTVSADDVRTVFATLKANSKNAGEYTYTAGEPSAGQYTVKLSNENYVVKAGAGKLYIEQLPVVLKWRGPLTFVEDNSTHTVKADVTNGVKGDTFALEYEENGNITHSQKNAGAYTAKVTELNNPNYTLGTIMSGTAMEASAQNVDQAWRIFEENDNITLTVSPNCTGQYTPITYGDPLTLTAAIKKVESESAPGSVDFYVNGFKVGSAPVRKQSDGTYKAVLDIANATAIIKSASETDIFFSLGANALRADYIAGSDEQVDAVTVFVNPKEIKAAIKGETDQVYDGNNMASGLWIEPVEPEPDDDVSVTADSFTYNDLRAGRANTVTAQNVMLIGAQSGNYVIKDKVTESGHILPKPVNLEWRGINNLIYSGDVPNVTAIATELIPNDKCSVTAVETDNDPNVGGHKARATKLNNDNYRLPDDDTVTYNIDPADLYIKSQTVRYNDTYQLVASADGVTPTRKPTEQVEVDITASSPNVGDYTYYIADGTDENTYTASTKDSNYKIAGGAIITIEKIDPIYTPPVPNVLVYNALPQNLVTAEDVIGGTMQYSFSEDGTYYTEIPTDIGDSEKTVTIPVWYRVVGDLNHNDIAPASVKVTIYPNESEVPKSDDDPDDPSELPGGWIEGDVVVRPSTSKPNTSDGAASSDPSSPDVSDDTTKHPDSSQGSDKVPNTGVEINYALYFFIMCVCGTAITVIFRHIKQ